MARLQAHVFRDARHYQIAALATLVVFNLGWIDFGARPANTALALAASLLTLGFAMLILLPGLALLAPFALARDPAAADRRRGYYLPLALALLAGLALPCLWLDQTSGSSLGPALWRLGNGWLDPATEAARREALFEDSVQNERTRGDALSKRFEEALRQAREEPVTRPKRDFDWD